jgi:hypothetical protein
MTGRQKDADSLFTAILVSDSAFSLDPIRTSPKIYEVYFAAKAEWQQGRPAPTVRADHGLPLPPPPPALPPPPAYRYGLYLCPFGAGLFYHRQKTKGVLFFAVQAVSLAAAVVLYQKRQDLEDPEYGWYQGNLEKNRAYVDGMRVGCSLAAAAWLAGVVDAFTTEKIKRKRRP